MSANLSRVLGIVIMSYMKKILVYVFSVAFLVGLFFVAAQVYMRFAPEERGALQVTSNVSAQVLIDDEVVGNTPFCKCDAGDTLVVGNYSVKIVPDDEELSPYTVEVDVYNGVLTAVDRTFLPNGLSSAYILTLESGVGDGSELLVQSIPDGAVVSLNGVEKGVTPLLDEDSPASEQEVEIQKSGFSKKTIPVRTVEGYRLVVNVILGAKNEEESTEKEADESADATEVLEEEESEPLETVTILQTPTGFLRVREGAGVTFNEVTTVAPGDTYDFIEEEDGWFHIQLDEESDGWVSSDYAERS